MRVEDDAAPFFIVFNIGSGHGDRDATRARIADAMHAAGRRYELHDVDDPSQLPMIAARAVRDAEAQHGVVVAAGGDGTINAVAAAVLGHPVRFGVLPQGTFNYFGRANGLSQQIDEALDTLLTGRLQPTQVGLVNGHPFLVNASIGLYPRILEDREVFKQRYGRHRLVALGAAIGTVLRQHRHWMLRIEDERGRAGMIDTPTLFVGNNSLQLEQVGLPQARDVEAGYLAAVAIKPVGRLGLFLLAFQAALGRLRQADDVIHFAFKQLRVTPLRRRPRPLKVATDGEIRWLMPPIELRVADERLNLLVPRDPAQAEQARQA